MTYNLYRVSVSDINGRIDAKSFAPQTIAADSSFDARRWYQTGKIVDNKVGIGDILAVRIREGAEVQVRDKRDNAIAIKKAAFIRVTSSGFADVEVIEDDLFPAGFKVGVPVSCIEPLEVK